MGGVDVVVVQKFVVSSTLDNRSIDHGDDLVRVANRSEAMGHCDGYPLPVPVGAAEQGLLDALLGLGVERCAGLIED